MATVGDPETDNPDPARPDRPTGRPTDRAPVSRTRLVGGVLRGLPTVPAVIVLLAVPLAVAVVVLNSPRLYPGGDLALIEINVREVFTRQPPLTGLLGRFGSPLVRGHHPGPLGFYSLAPVYTVAGRSAAALTVSGAFLSLLGLSASCWTASRRGGRALVLGTAASLAVLLVAYGPVIPVLPWNPYQPVFWWPVVILGVWSVVEDDLAVLPPTVFAASLCAQTHISYAGLVGGLGALAGAVLAVRAVRRRADGRELRRIAAWAGGSVVLGVLLWLPPIAQQIFGTHPNLSILARDFVDPPLPALGFGQGLEHLLFRLDPVRLVTGRTPDPFGQGTSAAGAVAAVVWLAAAVASFRLPDRRIRHLHLVLAAALVLGLWSASSIHGPAWDYLLLWGWTVNAFMLLAVAWTGAAALRATAGRRSPRWRRIIDGAVPATAVTLAISFGVVATVRAARADPPSPDANRSLGGVVPGTVAGLERSTKPGLGPYGRYLVQADDPVTMNNLSAGLLNELDRAGLDAGVRNPHSLGISTRWKLTPENATAVVNLSVGPAVARWRRCAGVDEIAAYDPRSPAERAASDRYLRRARAELERAGLPDLVPSLEINDRRLFRDPRLNRPGNAALIRRIFLDLKAATQWGFPVAVFVGPADISCRS